jgi:predicted nucleic acid-binding protein
VPIVGTFGVLALAGKRGILSDPWSMVLQLREKGLYLSDEVLQAFPSRLLGS